MSGLFTTALHITTPIGLAAFVFATAIWLIDRNLKSRSKKAHLLSMVALIGSLVVVALWLSGELYLRHEAAANSVYRVRVTVIGSNDLPVENAKVWSSIGGDPKAVAGGCEFDIPQASKPTDGVVVFFASIDNSFTQGQTTLTLAEDHFPAVSIRLSSNQAAWVRGTIEDEKGYAIGGVDVSVVGYGNEHVLTSAQGSFVLPAHAGEGQTVRLHAESKLYVPLDQDQPAGNSPAILVLHRKHDHK